MTRPPGFGISGGHMTIFLFTIFLVLFPPLQITGGEDSGKRYDV